MCVAGWCRLGGFVGVLGFTCDAGLKFFDAAGLLPGVDELAVVGLVCLVFTEGHLGVVQVEGRATRSGSAGWR